MLLEQYLVEYADHETKLCDLWWFLYSANRFRLGFRVVLWTVRCKPPLQMTATADRESEVQSKKLALSVYENERGATFQHYFSFTCFLHVTKLSQLIISSQEGVLQHYTNYTHSILLQQNNIYGSSFAQLHIQGFCYNCMWKEHLIHLKRHGVTFIQCTTTKKTMWTKVRKRRSTCKWVECQHLIWSRDSTNPSAGFLEVENEKSFVP